MFKDWGQKKTYDTERHKLETGDIVLFAGKGKIPSVIKWATKSKWSHVGMVLKFDEWDTLLLWESTTLSKIKDAIDGIAKRGVQLVVLSERVKSYDGEIAIRSLYKTRTPEMILALKNFRTEVRDRPYEESKVELLKSAYDGIFGQNEEDLSSLFCSELVAEAYQRMGLLSDRKPSNEYVPGDFADKYLFLERGTLGPLTILH